MFSTNTSNPIQRNPMHNTTHLCTHTHIHIKNEMQVIVFVIK